VDSGKHDLLGMAQHGAAPAACMSWRPLCRHPLRGVFCPRRQGHPGQDALQQVRDTYLVGKSPRKGESKIFMLIPFGFQVNAGLDVELASRFNLRELAGQVVPPLDLNCRPRKTIFGCGSPTVHENYWNTRLKQVSQPSLCQMKLKTRPRHRSRPPRPARQRPPARPSPSTSPPRPRRPVSPPKRSEASGDRWRR